MRTLLGIGTLAVQLAKHYGAQVTGVCSTANVDLVRSLGAEPVIDYTQKDFTQRGERYDLIFDEVGKTTASQCEHALALDGSFVTAQKGLARGGVEDLNLLRELIEAGELRSVIDRRYPLEQVAEAHRYVEAGQKQGNLIVTVGSPARASCQPWSMRRSDPGGIRCGCAGRRRGT